ncbi:MAG: hypothetical protein ABGW82_00510 [Paracoccus sp. (in: a-proteobacteria)]|jgi:hypothetical protein|uniref:hypothetical protein n=1 Tax=Paracoccus sp. TaxID=267 RepID=UPI00325A400E|nr:hypothetical protein [Paracoccus sp. (in: a-proteobacteria)]|tara:strand:- start:281 stop:550 length:270 start_codon:yes stop_codon:yes gene_type:complete
MSHNDNDPGRSARNHRPAVIAIVLALIVAALAWWLFLPGVNEGDDGIATTEPPQGTPVTQAEGVSNPDAAAAPAAGTEGAATDSPPASN